MRTKAFGVEPPEDLLDATSVAQTSVDVLIADVSGQVIDVRRPAPTVTARQGAAEAVKDQVEAEEAAAEVEAAREHGSR